MIYKNIPSTGETLPVLGLGTWQTFDVKSPSYPSLTKVLTTFSEHEGKLIDSSPMYGLAEQVIGDLTEQTRYDFFYATKVWTTGRDAGIQQMENSMRKMKRKSMDLMQIHNLTDWKTHLKTLKEWKLQGKIRYIGITHYTDAMHEELEHIINYEKIDFVQFNYSVLNRHAEKRLLPAAAHHGVATLINRPFGEGSLFSRVRNIPLPLWAKEHGIENWSGFFLKYLVSHPDVTCVIPATGDPVHAEENLRSISGSLPDDLLRTAMVNYLKMV